MSEVVQTIGGVQADGTVTGTTHFIAVYSPRTTVTLTAPATAGGSAFASWTGCTAVNANVCTVLVNSNTTVTVNYN
jgi:hypothetical protein